MNQGSEGWKIATGLLGVVVTLAMFIAGMLANRISAAEEAINSVAQEQKDQRERIAVAETYYKEINRRLEEMGKKLDQALR